MLTVYDSKNQPYVLTAKIGSGGEGTVFYCPDDLKTVAKIYHEPISDEKAEKLRWMANNKNESLSKIAAWITDTLHDAPNGKTIGFLMPNVKAKEIHELYSLKSRRVHFPEATWKFLVHAAANVARAFYNLHRAGHVMGDVNHGNCVVLADGTVKLIDCDSYAIKNETRRYHCEVGVATHLAPELQGKNLRGVEREFRHDNFGLAVIVFQLLFLGRHPFAGNYAGGEDKSLEECIRELRFAYGSNADSRGIKQPPGTLSLSSVSPRVALLFERAFLTEDRPEPREWIEALEDLSRNLTQCALHPGHHFCGELQICPWCEIETQTGLMLFPFTSGGTDGESFNIFTVESLVASFGAPQNLPVKLPPSAVLPPPSAEVKTARRYNRNVLALAVFAQFFIVMFLVVVFGAFPAFVIGILALFCSLAAVLNSNKIFREEFRDTLENARQQWERLNEDWQNTESSVQFRDNLDRIKRKIDDYRNLHRTSRNRIQIARSENYRRELSVYLSDFRVVYAEIPGIGEKRREILREFGVKTAADVEAQRLDSIPGVSSVTAAKLIDWRKGLEKSFAPPPAELSAAERESIACEVSSSRKNIEREIENLLGALRSGSMLVRRQHQKLLDESKILAVRIRQSESDLKAVGTNARAIVVLTFTTVFTLSLGSALTAPPPPRPISYSEPGIGSGSSGTVTGKMPYYPSPDYAVPDNLTDKQIESMPYWERRRAAETLHRQSMQTSAAEKEILSAERKMRLAVRLLPQDPPMLNQLAFLLYDQAKYAESIEILNRSLSLDAENYGTKMYLGMNYLRTEKYEKAERILAETAAENPAMMPAHYNLGLAYEGLREHHLALAAFRRAAEITPSDADSHYGIGRCLVETRELGAARKEYEKLRQIDPKTAEKLARLINSK
jgi:DNA-binding helix-hairpin-helix protein with protein kinase domain/Tfp pilus assembly protein PilF